jgi:DNA-binding GntR family transcriptional regulator
MSSTADPNASLLLGARHSALTQMVAQTLRERILDGSLPPGERLVEGRLSEELGVSRMPVREGLRLLAAQGLVAIEPRRGASVVSFTTEQVREMVEVRATLEGLNAKLAAKRRDPTQIAMLEAVMVEGASLVDTDDPVKLARLNADFHEALATVAGNSVLQVLVRSLRDRTELLFARMSRHQTRKNWDEHAGIMRAVLSGDAELAALLATRHVYSAAQLEP